MEHMKEKWKAEYSSGDDSWVIRSISGWSVALACMLFPDDRSGEKTAKAICLEHNSLLAARKGKK